MTPAQYKATRERIGTQEEVAMMLGINRVTIAKREAGATGWPITREAELAITALKKRRRKKP